MEQTCIACAWCIALFLVCFARVACGGADVLVSMSLDMSLVVTCHLTVLCAYTPCAGLSELLILKSMWQCTSCTCGMVSRIVGGVVLLLGFAACAG